MVKKITAAAVSAGTRLRKQDYPETRGSTPEEQRSIEVAQNWTYRLATDFRTFYAEMMTGSLSGGATITKSFEDLLTSLHRANPTVLLSAKNVAQPDHSQANIVDVRYKFAQLMQQFEGGNMMQQLLNASMDNKECSNWLFLYVTPNAQQFREVQALQVGDRTPVQPQRERQTKKKSVRFAQAPEEQESLTSVLTQRVLNPKLNDFVLMDLSSGEAEATKQLEKRQREFKVSRLKPEMRQYLSKKDYPFGDYYDFQLKKLEAEVRAQLPEGTEVEIEAAVDRLWVERFSSKVHCDRQTLWSMLDEGLLKQPYARMCADEDATYAVSDAFQTVNPDYSVLSSGFAALQKERVDGFPCFSKTTVANIYDRVWLLLDSRMQEYLSCSLFFRQLLQQSTDCQKRFFPSQFTRSDVEYIAVPPLLPAPSAVKENIKRTRVARPLQEKWILSNCTVSGTNVQFKDFDTFSTSGVKTYFQQLLGDTNESKYRYFTVPSSRLPLQDTPQTEESMIEMFANFRDAHMNEFNAVYIGPCSFGVGDQYLEILKEKYLTEYSEENKEKLFAHLRQYAALLTHNGIYGVLLEANDFYTDVYTTLFSEQEFGMYEEVPLGNNMVLLVGRRTLFKGGGGGNELMYLFKVKPQIQSILALEQPKVNQLLQRLSKSQVDIEHEKRLMFNAFKRLVFSKTVSEVNQVYGTIKQLQSKLEQVEKSLVESSQEISLSGGEKKTPLLLQELLSYEAQQSKAGKRRKTPLLYLNAVRQHKLGRVFQYQDIKELHRRQNNYLKLSF
jgi:hypothetical protein